MPSGAVKKPSPSTLGRYTLLRPLGEGGMAELHLARADGIEGFSKLVALKRILPHKASNEKFVRMLLNEARLVAGLDHPNIAQVYDIGQEDGQYFFAMEYVHGPDLRRILHAAPNRRLQLENVLHIAIGLCAGLHRAHEARDESGRSLEIVHRDVSPSNVLVSYQGAVKLVDFGVAKAATSISETRDGVIKGKFGYMSPEQCLGDALTRQSDVFNVGILLWEMTVGRRLYKISGELVTLQRIVYLDAPGPSRYIPNYPPALERIVMRALARDPAKRYQTTEQLQLELETFALEHRIPVSSVSMAMEMRGLFRERVEAWQEAQKAGQSLAEHLAELSSDDEISSSQAELGGLDAVINELDTSVFSDEPSEVIDPPTHQEPPAGWRTDAQPPLEAIPAPPAPAAVPVKRPLPVTRTSEVRPITAPVPPRRRSRAWAIVLLLLMGAGGVAVFLWQQAILDPAVPRSNPVAMAQPVDADVVVAKGIEDSSEQPAEATPTVASDEEPVSAVPVQKPTRDKRPARKPTKQPIKRAGKDPPSDDLLADRGAKEPVKEAVKEPVREPVKEPVKEPKPKEPPPPVESGPRPGTVDPAGVRAVVRSHLGAIETCVSRARMENRDLAGRVVIRIDVSPAGRVTNTAVSSSTVSNASLESCMTKAVASWSFPAPAGGVAGAFSYPFSF
jgi:TonB family protein